MTDIGRSVAALSFVVALFATPPTPRAEDFTFEIPLEVTRFAPRITAVNIAVRCIVSRALNPFGDPSQLPTDIIAQRTQVVPLGPGPVDASRVVTIAMNASSPRLRPASLGRYYGCGIGTINLTFPEGDTIALTPATLAPDYETSTGHHLTTVVNWVRGEIPR